MAKTIWRPVNGIVLLNKPLGLSSNQALQKVRRLYRAAKAGHTGALDPLASGMLPLCFGEATKFSQYLLDANKRYHTRIQLGVRTTTGDKEGDVLTEASVPDLSDNALEKLLDHFRGDIEQVPPMYSALKHEGKPLYEYARKGIVIERKRRQVHISHLSVIEREGNFLTLDIACSKGTYIRTIGEDIGELLGCGAHLDALHRVSTASYDSQSMLTFEALEQCLSEGGEEALDDLLLPMDSAVSYLSRVNLSNVAADDILFGRFVENTTDDDTERLVRLFCESSEQFLGLGNVKNSRIVPFRLINTSELNQTK